MFLIFNIVLLTVFLITFVENQFFKPYYTIGKFPKYNLSSEVNHPECGLRYVPEIQTIRFNKRCFGKNISDKKVYDFQWNNFGSQRNSPKIPLTRIFRGERASPGEAPWTVLIKKVFPRDEYIHKVSSYCTGVLITLEWVLTAAHCKSNDEKLYVLVQSGTITFDIKPNSDMNEFDIGRRYWMTKLIEHPVHLNLSAKGELTDYEDWLKRSHDIALIKLEKPLRRTNGGEDYFINTICLPPKVERNKDPVVSTVFGFGSVETLIPNEWFSDEIPEYLQKGIINLNNQDCGLTQLMVCAQYTNDAQARTCEGDSGGPLVYYVDKHNAQATLIGITQSSYRKIDDLSYILTDCLAHYRTKTYWVFVPNFVDWILDTISKN